MDETLEEVEELVADASALDESDADNNVDQAEGTDSTSVTPEFAELKDHPGQGTSAIADMNRLMDVKVTVSAELGKATLAIQDLLAIKNGSVIELDREVDSPVEIMAQGVPFGNGEVVIVDEKFAIRIQEIYAKPQ